MTRPVAMRASAIFVFFAAIFALIGVASGGAVAEALFLISGSVCAAMLFFAFVGASRAPAAIPVRARRYR